MISPRFKICCIQSIDEARMAIDHGASAVGLVSEMPSGPGPIPEEAIASIAAVIPPGVSTFLLTCRQDASSIIAQHRRCRTNTIQLVDQCSVSVYEGLREALPGIALVQVIHVRGEESVAEAKKAAAHANALLLDSGNPGLPVKELGGTGRTHDWSLSRRIRDEVRVPIYLAGGLNAGNVANAIAAVNPFGVDVCSGVRSNGGLDQAKLAGFVAAVRSTTWE
jgi:phosphoribosylanthranilate isomerase